MRKIILVLSLAFCLASGISAGKDLTNDELVEIVKTVAGGRATRQQKAIAFFNNDKINLLTLGGKISDADFQVVQSEYSRQVIKRSSGAAKSVGLVIGAPKVTEGFKAGTDTDIALQPGDGSGKKITAEQSIKVREATNKFLDEYAIESGCPEYAGKDHCRKLEIDAFASPENMSAEGYARQSNYINEQGGFAYTDPDATKVQIEIDAKSNNFSNEEAMAYHQEMMKHARAKEDKAMNGQKELSNIDNPDSKELRESDIRKDRTKAAKYRARGLKVTEIIAARNKAKADEIEARTGSKPESSNLPPESKYSGKTDIINQDAQLRDSSNRARRAEAAGGAMNEHLCNKAVRNFNSVIADTVKVGGNVDEAVKIIARTTHRLPPGQQGQSIDDLMIRNPDLAEKVNFELKKMNLNRPSVNQKPTVSTGGGKAGLIALVLGLANAGLNVANSSARGDTTTKILWDMSIVGPAVDATSNYTASEVERLMKKYRDAGEDTNSFYTKLKVLAEASVKGTIKGTTLGLHEAFNNLTFTGTVISAGNLVVDTLGQGLDTVNVLDTTYAEMQNQKMEQEIQNAMGARFGREAVAELRKLVSLAESIRSILRVNITDARRICRQGDSLLQDFQAFLRQCGETPGAAPAGELAETEARLAGCLKDSAASLAGLNGRANAALAALLAGGDPMAASREAASLIDSADQEAGILVRTKAEIDRLAAGASPVEGQTQAVYADYLARLQELSTQSGKDAAVIRQNEVDFIKVIEKFRSLREKVDNARRYFADRRQSREGDWMIIESDLKRIAAPDGTMPEGFAAEIGTLERLPEKIRAGLAAAKVPAVLAGSGQGDGAAIAQAAVGRLLPPYQADEQALGALREAIRRLLGEVDKRKVSSSEQTERRKLPCGHFPGDPECGTSRCRIICQDAGWIVEWPGTRPDAGDQKPQNDDAKHSGGIDLKSPSVSVGGTQAPNCSDNPDFQ